MWRTRNDAMGGSLEQLITSLLVSGTRTFTQDGKIVRQRVMYGAVSPPSANR